MAGDGMRDIAREAEELVVARLEDAGASREQAEGFAMAVLSALSPEYVVVPEEQQRGAVSGVVAWLRSDEWVGDETWEHYAKAIADAIERDYLKSTTGGGQ